MPILVRQRSERQSLEAQDDGFLGRSACERVAPQGSLRRKLSQLVDGDRFTDRGMAMYVGNGRWLVPRVLPGGYYRPSGCERVRKREDMVYRTSMHRIDRMVWVRPSS
jgi:hypothetical protein